MVHQTCDLSRLYTINRPKLEVWITSPGVGYIQVLSRLQAPPPAQSVFVFSGCLGNSPVASYIPGWREELRELFLAQEHETVILAGIRTRTAWPKSDTLIIEPASRLHHRKAAALEVMYYHSLQGKNSRTEARLTTTTGVISKRVAFCTETT